MIRKVASLWMRLFARHTARASPNPPQQRGGWELRDALLKCSALTEDEVDEYLRYEFQGIRHENVPLDYELDREDAELTCLYSDGVLQIKTLRIHTNQISPETLAKVRRVLPLLYLRPE